MFHEPCLARAAVAEKVRWEPADTRYQFHRRLLGQCCFPCPGPFLIRPPLHDQDHPRLLHHRSLLLSPPLQRLQLRYHWVLPTQEVIWQEEPAEVVAQRPVVSIPAASRPAVERLVLPEARVAAHARTGCVPVSPVPRYPCFLLLPRPLDQARPHQARLVRYRVMRTAPTPTG